MIRIRVLLAYAKKSFDENLYCNVKIQNKKKMKNVFICFEENL